MSPFLQRLKDRVTPTLDTFELDGNPTTQTTHDWDQVYNDAVINPGQNTSGSISGAVLFQHDPVNSPLDDIFSGGLSKDINDLNKWAVALGTPQTKADIAVVFAVAYQVQVGAQTHTILNFGADRFDNSGNATMGFWFFQNPIRLNANGTFTGAHAPGDILLVVDFSSSTATIDAYRWVGPGGSTGALQLLRGPHQHFRLVNTAILPRGAGRSRHQWKYPRQHLCPG